MDTAGKSAQQLREQITKAEEELRILKEQLAQAEARDQDQNTEAATGGINGSTWKWPLKADEYDRYGRQLILPNVGIQGQTTYSTLTLENKLLTHPSRPAEAQGLQDPHCRRRGARVPGSSVHCRGRSGHIGHC